MHSTIKSTILLLLLTVALYHCDETICPARNDIYPCSCFSVSLGLRVVCNGWMNVVSSEDVQNAVGKLSGKQIYHLRLSKLNLDQSPPELFNEFSIQRVDFSDTNLGEMPTFKGSESTLQELEFVKAVSHRSIQNFTLKVSSFNKLKIFTFKENYYFKNRESSISFGNEWFENAPSSLEKVDLSDNQAKSFGDRIFTELVNLKEIDLSGNRMGKVYRSMFPDPAKSLSSITLKANSIKTLPENIFSNMPVLAKVDVAHNTVIILDETTWRPVWEQLDSLILGTTICDSTISWIFESSKPGYLRAYCSKTAETYEEYRGRHLNDIIKEKQGLSSNTN